jgi:hypothetical protein
MHQHGALHWAPGNYSAECPLTGLRVFLPGFTSQTFGPSRRADFARVSRRAKSVLGEYYSQKQALSRFCVAALVLSEPVLGLVRREL